MKTTTEIIEKAAKSHNLEKKEVVALLQCDANETQKLFKAADTVRKNFVGDAVQLRGLIEFSNICRQNCLYCGLRRSNKTIERYRLTPVQIVEFAKNAAELGFKTIVLQSGEDAYFDTPTMTKIIKEIKALNVAITLSIGEKTLAQYQAYKKAGADRYLLRIETTDAALYEKMNPGMTLQNRIECLKNLQLAGFEVGTGSLVGLPGQSIESIACDILFFKQINADMIGIGPFIPNEDTPLWCAPDVETERNLELSLKMMAITRLMLPDINIPATTAMETIDPAGRMLALQSGANVVMPNVTQRQYKKQYALYPGKISISDDDSDTPENCRNSVIAKIKSIDRVVSTDFGFRGNNSPEFPHKN